MKHRAEPGQQQQQQQRGTGGIKAAAAEWAVETRPGECVRGPGRAGGGPLPQPEGDPRCFPLQGAQTLRKGARCGRARRAQAGMESYRPELSAGGASGTVGAAAAEGATSITFFSRRQLKKRGHGNSAQKKTEKKWFPRVDFGYEPNILLSQQLQPST